MNPLDDQLDRLFRAAAASPGETSAPPFGLETRVLASWRGAKRFDIWSSALLVRGLLAACVMMLLSFWVLLGGSSNPDADYLQLADSTLQVSNNP